MKKPAIFAVVKEIYYFLQKTIGTKFDGKQINEPDYEEIF
jgi:hypothetical protein